MQITAAARKKQTISAGRKHGAVLGVFFFLGAGMLPGFSLGCYAALMLLAHLAGSAAEPGWLAGSVIAAGGMTGVVCAGAILILCSSVAGMAFASSIESVRQILRNYRAEKERNRKGVTVLMHRRMAESTEAEVRSGLSFLADYRDSIHSIVAVGSAAHASSQNGSDVDIVIVCKKEGLEAVRNAVCDREISSAFDGPRELVFEYTLLVPSETQKLFQVSSPFAYALCHGLVLEDDGYLGTLPAAALRAPSRKFVITALYESIIVPYYGSFRSLHKNAQARTCSLECCRKHSSGCEGLSFTDLPLKVIMRMLYLTLPLRGCMPLIKEDLATFATWMYGEESAEVVRRAVSLARNDAKRIYYTDYLQFRLLAGTLYRELLRSIGIDRTVSRMLRDGASMVQGKYGQLENRAIRKVVQNT